jgi:hypothetical protein
LLVGLLGCSSSNKDDRGDGGNTGPAGDAGTGNDPGTSFSLPYTPGELAGQTSFYEQLTPALDKTAAALVQAVLTVNSFLFTDPAVTNFATLQARKAEADQALEVLAKYAAATENLIDATLPSQDDGGVTQNDAGAADALMSMADASGADARASTDARAATDGTTLMPMRLKGLSPEEVLATVSSGPSTSQIKTLMKAYNVNAKKAQLILNTAMAGLEAQAWNDEAKSMDTLMRQATLVKETAKLGVTIVGTAITAGGVSGVLTVAQSAKAIVSGTKGVIAVSKAGAELIMGKDLVIKEGSKESLVMTTVDTVSDIIAIGNFQKILTGTATAKDKLKGIVTIASKVKNAFENQTITFGELKVDFKDGLSIGSSVDVGYINSLLGGPANPPSTLPGTYKIFGIPNVVTTMPQDIINAITKFLPIADIVNGVLIAPITPESLDAGTPDTRPDAGLVDARTLDTRTPDVRTTDTRTSDAPVQTCPGDRYTITAGTSCNDVAGLVKDNTTGLVWTRTAGTWLTHAAAEDYCSGKGMRLPTVDELMVIKKAMDNCVWCGWKTWTATPDASVKGYWYYDYYSDPGIYTSAASDIATAGALCVR